MARFRAFSSALPRGLGTSDGPRAHATCLSRSKPLLRQRQHTSAPSFSSGRAASCCVAWQDGGKDLRPRRVCKVVNVEDRLVPYTEAWGWQRALVAEKMAWQRTQPPEPGHDTLLMLEHPSVYTLGRKATLRNLKFDPQERHHVAGAEELRGMKESRQEQQPQPGEVIRVDRGGEVTWHGPGQLVCYPLLDLNYHARDLHWYLRMLEEVIIQTLHKSGLHGERNEGNTGVWVGGAKYAAIGLNASRWVSMHGFSINVAPDMQFFGHIVPCGIADKPVGCMCRGRHGGGSEHEGGGPRDVTMDKVRADVLQSFQDVFGVDLEVSSVAAIAPPSPAPPVLPV